MDHARVKWRIKLSESFQAQSGSTEAGRHARSQSSLLLFWLPFVTVLREGLEGIVFMGGGPWCFFLSCFTDLAKSP